jgi:hypothetical protein
MPAPLVHLASFVKYKPTEVKALLVYGRKEAHLNQVYEMLFPTCSFQQTLGGQAHIPECTPWLIPASSLDTRVTLVGTMVKIPNFI